MTGSRRVLRLPTVLDITGLARSTLYKAMKDGKFPAAISLGDRAVGWLESDVLAWLDSRVAMSREAANDSKR